MFTVKIEVAPDIMKELFKIDNWNYNFCYDFLIKQHIVRPEYYTTPVIGPKNVVWDTSPNGCKNGTLLKRFKEIKKLNYITGFQKSTFQ